jgi:hypothetical protein
MKKALILLPVLFLHFSGSASYAQTPCMERYIQESEKKENRREKKEEVWGEVSGAAAGAVGGAGIAEALSPRSQRSTSLTGLTGAAAVLGVTQLVRSYYSISSDLSREKRVVDAEERAENGRGLLISILKDSLRKNPNATLRDVSRIVNEGFLHGDFCTAEDLYTPREIRAYVLERI